MTSFPLENKLSDTDARYLRDAIRMSIVAKERGNRPFGAVVISKDGQLLAEAYGNTTESGDCTGHAELTAVRIVSPNHTRSVLAQATLYSSAEPCVMCAGAIKHARFKSIVIGAMEPKTGFSNYVQSHFNSKTTLKQGVLETECKTLMQTFFAAKRKN